VHPRTQYFAPASAGVRREAEHWPEEGVAGAVLGAPQEFLDLRQRQEKAVPQFLPLLRRHTASNLPFDLLPRLEGRLVIPLGILEPAVGKTAGHERHLHAPVPRRTEAGDFLADGGRAERALAQP